MSPEFPNSLEKYELGESSQQRIEEKEAVIFPL